MNVLKILNKLNKNQMNFTLTLFKDEIDNFKKFRYFNQMKIKKIV